MPKKLETTDASREIIVEAAMAFIEELSFLVSRAIPRLVSASFWLRRLYTKCMLQPPSQRGTFQPCGGGASSLAPYLKCGELFVEIDIKYRCAEYLFATDLWFAA
jgi:hypothetical protein